MAARRRAPRPVHGRVGLPVAVGLPVTAMAGLLTVLVTATARLAYEDTYRQVGTTLDAVGLSNARLLTFGATVALTLVGLALLSVVAATELRHVLRTHGHARFADAAMLVCLVGVFAALTWGGLTFVPSVTFFASLGTAVALPLLAYVDLGSSARRSGQPAREPRTMVVLDRARPLILPTILPLAGLLAASVLSGAAAAGRALADSGPAVARDRGAGLLDLAPVPVCVRTLQGRPVEGLAPAQLLLGTNAGVHVLLAPEPGGARAQVVPAAAVRLEGRAAAGPNGLPDCS